MSKRYYLEIESKLVAELRPGETIKFNAEDKKPTHVKRIERCDSWPAIKVHINTQYCISKQADVLTLAPVTLDVRTGDAREDYTGPPNGVPDAPRPGPRKRQTTR